jgi:hypothetical protein
LTMGGESDTMVLSIGELRRARLFMQSGSEKKAIVFYCALAAGILLSVGGYARGDIVTMGISGYVSSIGGQQGALPEAVNLYDVISGYYIYETTAIDTNPSLTEGDYDYRSSPFGISLNLNGMIFASNPQNVDFQIVINNDYKGTDSYILNSNNNLPLSNGTTVTQCRWELNDNTASALSNDLLISPDSVWGNWQNNILTITCRGAGVGVRIEANITDAKVTEIVPEPASVLMILSGFLFIGRRKSKKQISKSKYAEEE